MSNLFKKVTSTASAIAIASVAMGSTLTAFAASDFATYAEELATAGVINTQNSEAGYRLGDNITRAEMAKIAVMLAESEAVECVGDVFGDVTSSLGDLCGFIESAADAGIVSTDNNNFRPKDLVTRAEMVKMLLAARGVVPTDVSAGFSDVNSSLNDLEGYINAAVEAGLIKSGTTFRPNATATRGEAFKVAAGAYALEMDEEIVDEEEVTEEETTNTGSTNTGVTVGTPVTGVSTGDLVATLNPATPAATTLATGSAYNKVLVVDLKAGSSDATVTGVEVTRTGLLSNTNVAGVSAWVDGSRVGNVAQSLTSDGKASISFGTTPVQIKAGETKTLTIALNVKGGVYSGTVGLTLSKVMAGGTVTGTPVSSSVHSVVDGTQALVQYAVTAIAVGGGTTEGAAVSLDVGQSTEIAKFKVEQSNSKEDLTVEGVNVFMEGSVSDGDLDGFEILSQDGNVLATATTSVGRYVNFKFTTAYVIPQGSSRFFTVKAKIAEGKYNSKRTYSAKIRDDFDIVAKGTTTGNYVLATSLPATQYWYQVREGTVTVAKATDSRSQSTAPGVDDVELASFDVKASGEDLEFQKINFKVTKGAGNTNLRGTLKLTVDGVTVYSTDSGTATNYTTGAAPGYLSSYFIVKSGATAKVKVLGSIATSAGATDTYKATLIDASYKLISSNSIKTLTLNSDGNTLAVENVTLSASSNGSFSAGTLVKGQSSAKIGSFNLQASNADDINVTTVGVGLSTTPAATVTGINNLTLKVGSTTIATSVASPQATGNTFSINAGALKVGANSTVTVDVYADVTSAATATAIAATLEASKTSGVGVKTAVSVTAPAVAQTSSAVSVVGNGSLSVEADSLTPAKQILVAGLTNVEILRFKVRADNKEDVRLDKLTIGAAVANTATNLGSNLTNVKLFDGSTQIGQGSVTFVDNKAKFTGLNFVVPKAGTKSLSVRADTTASATLQAGRTLAIAPTEVEYTGVAGGSNTPLATVANTLAPSSAMLLQDVKVVATAGTVSGTKGPSQDVASFNLKAEGARDLNITTLKVNLTTSNATGALSNVVLRYNNSDYSTAVINTVGNVTTATFTLGSAINVTAGTTVALGIRANTSALSVVANQGSNYSVTVSLPGVSGATDTSNAVSYSYSDANGNAYTANTSDSYPVTAPAINF